MLGGSCRPLILCPRSVWKAQVPVGSGRRGLGVPRGSRVGENETTVER